MSNYLKELVNKIKSTKLVKELVQNFMVKEDPELKDLMRELEYTRNRLEAARSNFNFADDEMIEYYTYIIMANEVKFGYLTRKYQELKQIKEYTQDAMIIPEELKERRAL